MRAVIQRVSRASVRIDGTVVSEIGRGLLVFLGVRTKDEASDARRLAAKVVNLRVFEDSDGKMNRGLTEAGGSVLCVSQFTLYGTVRRGNRPSFDEAAGRDVAEPLYALFCAEIEAAGVVCKRGVFGAEMRVGLENDGPVTVIIDTEDLDAPRRA